MNSIVLKRYMSYVLAAFIPALIGFAVIIFTKNIIYGGFAYLMSALLIIVLAKKMSTTALVLLEENPQPFILDISSTGIWKIIPATMDSNKILHFKMGKINRSQLYNRDLAHTLRLDNKTYKKEDDKDNVIFTVKKDDLWSAHYKALNKPFFVYDSVSKMMLSKEALSTFETALTTRHAISNLLAHQEQLILSLKPFARHVMDLLQGGHGISGFLKSWGWILLLVIIGIIGVLFLPAIIQTVQTTMQSGLPHVANAVNSTPAVPKVI